MSKKNTADFESSLKKLEDIVETMEEESLPLEKLLAHYEEGIQTVKLCESALQNAHKQLEIIRKNTSKTKLTPSKNKDNPDDEIRLF